MIYNISSCSAIFALMTGVTALLPAVDNARIGIATKDGSEFDKCEVTTGNGTAYVHKWEPETTRVGKRSMLYQIPPSTWTKIGFTCTVKQDCDVSLRLVGPAKREVANGPMVVVPVTYDQVEATGVTILNGGFEDLVAATDLPKSWYAKVDENSLPRVTHRLMNEGKNAVEAWHSSGLSQTLKAKAGVPVTITVFAYSEVDPAKK